MKQGCRIKSVLKWLNHYFVFFLLVAFVITCCTMLFVSTLRDTLGITLINANINENIWEKAEIEIETDFAEDVKVKADAELLGHVWNNLFSNAFKFTPSGGTVTVSLTATEHHAIVKVTDTGCGMTPEVGAHIFEKFYQGDTSHSARGNGLEIRRT